ncbi:hypothetical protein SEA_ORANGEOSWALD_84 [Mycobacterium phage OrangeOswald]|uniref:Uncharacterized protein n=5 Tax=Pipefishvirus TaxID=1982899 RepID=X2KRC6_9CAUD|nr:hypothetical protein AUDREY_85 [Mycobacterium phage Audrey]AKF15012.1 hypothetical protein SEA_ORANGEOSWALD_84 [Mycobacterium phage OrangeOswald]AKG94884.1 hypothetical protein SEA_COROFIN_85 [Mycobacterium phage Corofin]AVJ49089.1 hypothetical protein PBI_BALOO_84 [Mycobacterium phage Baloo]AWY03801.1 hypothetical protein MORTCELLUS_85 [Mycobacterium phage Mortcellus]QAY13700.1 hypothetical protein SEA_ROMAT_85 [Mycobacterium phage RomaT]UDG78941.1 hypothetical protein SEA_LESTYG_83 [Myco
MMQRASVAVALAALIAPLAACGGDQPVPAHGTVIDREFTPAWVQMIPGTPPVCSGNPPVCTPGTPPQLIPWPDQWSMTIRDLNNPEWQGTVTDGTPTTFDQCEVGELWPECWGGVPGA